jgi:hypothetical protein
VKISLSKPDFHLEGLVYRTLIVGILESGKPILRMIGIICANGCPDRTVLDAITQHRILGGAWDFKIESCAPTSVVDPNPNPK